MANSSPEAKGSGTAGLKLMVVDDDSKVTEVLPLMLSALGYVSTAYNNPLDAIQGFEEGIDGVMTDFNMPDMNGSGLIRSLREKTQLPLPAILMSGLEMNFHLISAGEFQAFLMKPFLLDDITKALSNPEFLQMVAQRRELRSV